MTTGWENKPLGEVCNIVGGGTPSKANSSYYGGDIPWATVRDMREELLSTTECRISNEAVAHSATNIIPRNNVVIATRVGLGKVCILAQDTAINQDLRGVVPKNKKYLDVRFLFRWFQSISKVIESEGTGLTVKGVKLPFVKSLKVPVPPLSEQKRIVAILDEAFEGIVTATANAEKNLANARELFESYLNAVFSNKGEEWVDTTVGQLVDDQILEKPLDGNHGDTHPKKADFVQSGVPFIMASDLVAGEVDQMHCNFLTRSQADSLRKGFAVAGDVLLSHKGTIGRVAVLQTSHDYVMLTPQVTYYRIKDGRVLHNRYLYYFFQSPKFQVEICHIAGAGSTRAYIGITKQLELKVSYPDFDVQRQIARRFDALIAETRRLETIYRKKLAELTELKQSLLQKAFDGKLTAGAETAIKEDATA